MDVTFEEIVSEMRTRYPDKFEVCVFAAANRKLEARVAELESAGAVTTSASTEVSTSGDAV